MVYVHSRSAAKLALPTLNESLSIFLSCRLGYAPVINIPLVLVAIAYLVMVVTYIIFYSYAGLNTLQCVTRMAVMRAALALLEHWSSSLSLTCLTLTLVHLMRMREIETPLAQETRTRWQRSPGNYKQLQGKPL